MSGSGYGFDEYGSETLIPGGSCIIILVAKQLKLKPKRSGDKKYSDADLFNFISIKQKCMNPYIEIF